MRTILCMLLVLPWFLEAQEPYRNLVISEAFVHWETSYIEITNMGDSDINLKEFKLGGGRSTSIPENLFEDPWSSSYRMFLPDFVLKPGESYVITSAFDFGPREYERDPYSSGALERPKNPQWYDLADILMHLPEAAGDETDSITDNWNLFKMWGGDNFWYLEHHFAEGDSAVIDQFNGVVDGTPEYDGRAVAGVDRATIRGPIVRKFTIKTGNLDFANSKGVGAEDSEWIPLPYTINNSWRDVWWTVGNHGDFVLDANTLESDVIEVDFQNKKLTVPWGIRRLDGIMRNLKKKAGVVWHYILNSVKEDSLYRSVRTGDKLEVIVSGNDKMSAVFDIVVNPPAEDVNIVVPMDYRTVRLPGLTGPVTTRTQVGIDSWPRVTSHEHGVDTITGVNHGLAFALRTDSLLKRLEKPSTATWEFVWVDGIPRPDLKDGDKLKVIAQNGNIKEYYIQLQPYRPGTNANLSSITWPDIPEHLKGIYGWQGDTIPGFSSATTEYKLEIPYETSTIPHLVASPQSLNATVEVKRATSLSGSKEDRTITFTVTAADKTTQVHYNIELVREKEASKVQPYYAEPLFTEYISGDQDRFYFLEIYNPGNQPLDLSNYMIASAVNADLGNTILNNSRVTDYYRRFRKYVPGYKYVSETDWAVRPGILEQDLAVNPIVQPGECFVLAYMQTARPIPDIAPWRALGIGPDNKPSGEWVDIGFILRPDDPSFSNPWGEFYSEEYGDNCVSQGRASGLFLFKILNDSIKNGLKPVTDPNDFQVVDALVNADGSNVRIAGIALTVAWQTHVRKPEVQLPNAVNGGSNGITREDSEWLHYNEAFWVNNPQLSPWPGLRARNHTVFNLNKHFMIESTQYISTISSVVYKVSDGYSMNEAIRGVKTGTTVGNFLEQILKEDEGQELIVKAKADNSELSDDEFLSNEDILLVVSADGANQTQYIIEVTDDGLSSDAILKSEVYDISIMNMPVTNGDASKPGNGTVSGFEYGTRLSTFLNNISIPAGSTVDVINSAGVYVPLKKLNYDTTYVEVTVNSDTYLEVLAEDGVTRIVYQLQPSSSMDDAFVLSDVYAISQSENLIQLVPRGTYPLNLLSNLIPASGASLKVIDKMGHERTEGSIFEDDKVVVTSANGLITRVYHLAMLRTAIIPEATYLAYVLSNDYAVDQVGYEISQLEQNTSIHNFLSLLMPSEGASLEIIDISGVEKTSGVLEPGDKLKVTSRDGKIKVLYDIDIVTSSGYSKENQFSIYPNPTLGKITVAGLEKNVRIQVFNQNGALIMQMSATREMETVSLDNQPSGMYLIVLTKDFKFLNQFKVLKN